VITYVGINLTNKKFQVGSTTDFERRCKEHHNSDMNPEFHRALRKNPENFYWVQGEDDGLDDRSEEQYMLDFYCGSMWCYNSNPSASEPPSQEGTSWWNNGVEQVKVFECPGENWVRGRLEKRWTDGKNNKFSIGYPGEGWVEGWTVSDECRARMSESGSGNVWWTNGVSETRAKECPGEGWSRGRIYSAEGKVAWTNGVENTFSVDCPGEGWSRGMTLSEEQRKSLGDSNRGKKYGKRDPSVGQKISDAKKGKPFSEEHKKAISDSHANRPVLVCPVCGKEVKGGNGNLKQHMRSKHPEVEI
jgi:predicted GIY-YIG superfamily endonuclease